MERLQQESCDQTPKNAFRLNIINQQLISKSSPLPKKKDKYSLGKITDRNYYLNNILMNESRTKFKD